MLGRMRVKPSLRPTETYSEPNFLRLYTAPARVECSYGKEPLRLATIEHLCAGNQGGLKCETIVDGEEMTRADALLIARGYAAEHGIPVIYECHSD